MYYVFNKSNISHILSLYIYIKYTYKLLFMNVIIFWSKYNDTFLIINTIFLWCGYFLFPIYSNKNNTFLFMTIIMFKRKNNDIFLIINTVLLWCDFFPIYSLSVNGFSNENLVSINNFKSDSGRKFRIIDEPGGKILIFV